MMKKTITYLLFSLLLAVGWTTTSSAQDLLREYYATHPHANSASASEKLQGDVHEMSQTANFETVQGATPRINQAPRRALGNVTSDVVHPKSWYAAKTYTWYDAAGTAHTAPYTDVVTDSCQMYWFIRSLYTDTSIPGITYEGVYDADVTYRGIDWGYMISGPVTQDIKITMTGYVQINGVAVYDLEGNLITSKFASSTATTEGWTLSGNLSRAYDSTNEFYYWYYSSSPYSTTTSHYTAITISNDLIKDYNGVYVVVRARQTYSDDATRNYTYTVEWDGVSKLGERKSLSSSWQTDRTWYTFPIDAPKENGYSIVLVKLTNDYDFVNNFAPAWTYSRAALYSYFSTYVDELQLLTDGLRVAEGTDAAGTVFTYTGDLNRFYFIGKGKTYPIATPYSSSENYWVTSDGTYRRWSDYAPFYSMFEEFSPTSTEGGSTNDFYSEMVAGDDYGVIHDCQGVARLKHFFSMTGIEGTENKSVSSMLLYIPDNRSIDSTRNYSTEHQPQTGLYTIALTARAQRVEDYADDNRYYNVTVDWTSSLDIISGVDVPQTYELWRVTRDENGNPVRVELLTTTTETSYSYTVPQHTDSYTIEYIVKGTPTNATNPDQFYTWSNLDNVLIPGYYDFVLLMNGHYESDFEVGNKLGDETNYYRNYMYLANSSEGTGMRPGQIKREWPNQTASYTLWRDNRGVATLKVLAIDDKVYYKIVYDEDSQDTTGPNAITVTNPSNTK